MPSQLQASMLAMRLARPNLPQASIHKNGVKNVVTFEKLISAMEATHGESSI
jgi:hypothetical protein